MRVFSAHLMRHTWATDFMRAPGASLLELKRQGGWERRRSLWAAARKRLQRTDAPESFADAMSRVLAFVEPPYLAAAAGENFAGRWEPNGRHWQA